ncbi:MAG: hypothetical protein IT239_00520 [Bacteroidia bacterium]|nr:hypothetical protein [Bacteroidia bacterium]
MSKISGGVVNATGGGEFCTAATSTGCMAFTSDSQTVTNGVVTGTTYSGTYESNNRCASTSGNVGSSSYGGTTSYGGGTPNYGGVGF